MTVSACVPVRNGARYLGASLDSVLEQVPPPDEVVVVDDGSTDDTPAILESYGDRIRWERRPASGHAATMNRVIALSRGDLVSFNDADDLWVPGRLRLLLDVLEDDAVDAAFGWVRQFASPELDPAALEGVRIDEKPQLSWLMGTMLVRRTLLHRVGPLDESLKVAANVDWISRARHAGMHAEVVESVVSLRRIHDRNMSRELADVKRQHLLQIMRAHRRRQDETER